jgi:chromosomal replication initiation ATPase DnaA
MSIRPISFISRTRACPRQLLDWRFGENRSTAQVARLAGLEPREVCQRMAAKLELDIRLLTGRLVEIKAEMSPPASQLTVKQIVRTVAADRDFIETEITEPGRMKKREDEQLARRVLARQIAIYLANKLLKLPYQPLAIHFKIGPSSVGLSIRNIAFRYNHDKTFKGLIDLLAKKCLDSIKR